MEDYQEILWEGLQTREDKISDLRINFYCPIICFVLPSFLSVIIVGLVTGVYILVGILSIIALAIFLAYLIISRKLIPAMVEGEEMM